MKNTIIKVSAWICIAGAALSLFFGIISSTCGDTNYELFGISAILLLVGNGIAEDVKEKKL